MTQVPGLPTKEIFDLLVDRKGFLWVGHDMGISRFDGVSFTHFAHPARSSLSISDLAEDSLGRIWFHNFTGQVFYIENERMHLLEAYKNDHETYFPRLVLLENEIVVTSNRGLFVCDTRTLKSRYLTLPGVPSSTQSLAVVNNSVVAHAIDQWYLYDKARGFRKTTLHASGLVLPKKVNLILQKDAKRDTALLVANPSGTIYKIGVLKGGLKLLAAEKVNNFINAVQVQKNQLQVHGKEASFTSAGGISKPTVVGKNISDMVTDYQGNTWYSSLSSGLLVESSHNNIRKIKFNSIQENDRVTIINKLNQNFLMGTKNGVLLEINPQTLQTIWKYKTPNDLGAINNLFPINENEILVSNSIGTFSFDIKAKKLNPLYSFISKGIVLDKQKILISSATGLFAFPFPTVNVSKIKERIWSLKDWNEWWQQYLSGQQKENPDVFNWYLHRSRSLALTQNKNLYVSFMNGVHYFGKKGVELVLYKERPVYSNSLHAHGNKIYISTLNNGLLIKQNGQTKRIGIEEGLLSNSIIKIKADQTYLWIMQDRGIQLLDMQSDRIITDFELPEVTGANIYDVSTWKDTTLLATNEGLYKIILHPSKRYSSLRSVLNLVVVNQKDSIISPSGNWKYNQNDIEFHLAVPWYSPSNSLYFKYRLKGAANDGQWYTTQPGERFIRFASLMPGNYTFEAYAVVAGFQEKSPVLFRFTISKPWWLSPLFFLAVVLLTGAGFYAIYLMRLRQVLRLEQVRRTISSDLHDEIGSTISSINIYSELAKSEKPNEVYLKLIQENTRDVIGKLDDLVWSINPKNDSIQQLLARMQSFAEPVLTGAGIQAHFSVEEDVMKQELSLEKKRHLYLSFKELVNNVVKHSRAGNCFIKMGVQGQRIILTVEDDGIGMTATPHSKDRSGMYNLNERAKAIGSVFAISGLPGKGTHATLTVPVG